MAFMAIVGQYCAEWLMPELKTIQDYWTLTYLKCIPKSRSSKCTATVCHSSICVLGISDWILWWKYQEWWRCFQLWTKYLVEDRDLELQSALLRCEHLRSKKIPKHRALRCPRCPVWPGHSMKFRCFLSVFFLPKAFGLQKGGRYSRYSHKV